MNNTANPDPLRHNSERLFRAQEQAIDLWGAPSVLIEDADADPRDLPSVSLPFYIGGKGGAQCDVYAFTVTYAASLGHEPLTKDVCLKVPRERLGEVQKSELVRDEMFWHFKLREVRIEGNRPDGKIQGIPKMVEFDFGDDNVLESPYIGLEWVPGKRLEWSDSVPERAEDRKKVLKQVADITLSLVRVNEMDGGYGAREWMGDRIEAQIERICGTGDESSSPASVASGDSHAVLGATRRLSIADRTMDSALEMAATQHPLWDKYSIAHLENAPLVLSHGGIDKASLIVDEAYNVTLIDFGSLYLAPLQFAATYPRFLTHEPEALHTPPTTDNRTEKEGWAKGWGVKDTLRMQKDREMYLGFVQKAAKRAVVRVKKQKERDEKFGFDKGVRKSENEWPIHRLLEAYSEVLGGEDEVNRYWWMAAMDRVGVYAQMEACGWVPKTEVLSGRKGISKV